MPCQNSLKDLPVVVSLGQEPGSVGQDRNHVFHQDADLAGLAAPQAYKSWGLVRFQASFQEQAVADIQIQPAVFKSEIRGRL